MNDLHSHSEQPPQSSARRNGASRSCGWRWLGRLGQARLYSALQLAFGLGSKVGLIDTEHGSGDLYADLGNYDVITLEPPFSVQKYRDAIRAFEEAGYDTIIVDSLSHAWSGEGGLLDKQGQLENSGKYRNSFATWREITPEHNKLVEQMLGSSAHVIATMRTKTEYVVEKDDRGKNTVRKLGLSPVQRDGVEYEFTVVMDIVENHTARASKDRTTLVRRVVRSDQRRNRSDAAPVARQRHRACAHGAGSCCCCCQHGAGAGGARRRVARRCNPGPRRL